MIESRPKLGRYTGPAYPFRSTIYGVLGPKTDVEVLFTSMVNILTTVKGTIPYDPSFGSEIPNLVFEPNDEITRSLIRHFVVKDLGEQEPRVNVIAVRTDIDPVTNPYFVNIVVSWTVVGDPSGQVFSGPVGFRLSAAA
jgi:phage baseplate assembly protein W